MVPSSRIINPRWRTTAILEIEKWPYLGNGLTNRHKTWHGGAYLPSEAYRKLKFPTSKNPRWQTAAILKNQVTAITQQRFD